MATSRQVTGWSTNSAFNNNNSYNNRNNTAGGVRISPQNCHIPSFITRERLWHHKIVTWNCSSTNEAILLKFSRSKGYSKHQSVILFRASSGLWYWLGSFICTLFLVTQKLLNLLVVFILCGTLLESPSFLVDTVSWYGQTFAHIKNLWFCTKEVTK